MKTVADFNAAVMQKDFNPAIKDGKGTQGITPPKSNWALPLDTPPYVGFAVTTGISFTFGGLHITADAPGDRHASSSPSAGSTPRASWWAGSSTTTTRGARA